MTKNLVSIIIPTKNSSYLLGNCLKSIRNQKYKKIEIIIVDDGKSRDINQIKVLTKKYKCTLLIYDPKVKHGLFDATKKRNYAAKKISGEYIYHVDADMEMTSKVIAEAVDKCKKGADAIIMTEESFGEGRWAQAKILERRFFWGDNTVESPRFFLTEIWNVLKGYDIKIAGGGDDRDIYQRALKMKFKVDRTKNFVMHNEGKLKLFYLMKKQFMYKREVLKYVRKRGIANGVLSFFPVRKSHIKNLGMFVKNPKVSFYFIIMKSAESAAGLAGVIYSLFPS